MLEGWVDQMPLMRPQLPVGRHQSVAQQWEGPSEDDCLVERRVMGDIDGSDHSRVSDEQARPVRNCEVTDRAVCVPDVLDKG